MSATALLRDVRRALFYPFADPVLLRGKPVSRKEARALERVLDQQRKGEPLPDPAPASLDPAYPHIPAHNAGAA